MQSLIGVFLCLAISYLPSELCTQVIKEIKTAKVIDQATFSLEYHARELDVEELDHAASVLLGRVFGEKSDLDVSLKEKLKTLDLIQKIRSNLK